MTRRLVLAWSAGATAGLLVGFLVGESVRDGLDLARLRRPEPREGAGTGTSATAGGNGAQSGDFKANVVARRLETGLLDALDQTAADLAPFTVPAQRDDEPTFGERGRCTRRSPGGGLVCIVHGPHTEHWYEAVYAPDAKDDADERIE